MKQKIIETIKKYNLINSGDKIVLGVSGGPDSIAMLDILNQLKDEMNFEIYVVHVNHNIRGKDADGDEEYVKKYCEKYNIKFFAKKIDVPTIAKTEKIGTEEAGRKVRYEYFEEILKETKSNKIAIAHNKNDKVETIIMHLLRGSGVSGLRGIEPIREEKFIKPLIECDKQEIENYCKENNLQPRIDKTNFENEYTRNKIRHNVIPVLKEINPSVENTVLQMNSTLSEIAEYIEKSGQLLLKIAQSGEGYLTNKLKDANIVVLKEAIAILFRQNNFTYSRKHIEETLTIIENGGKINLKKNLSAINKQGLFRIAKTNDTEFYSAKINIGKPIVYNDKVISFENVKINGKFDKFASKNYISSDIITPSLRLRNRLAGDTIFLAKRKVTKSLKKLMNELKVPEEKRDNLLVLADGNQVHWIEGIAVSEKAVVKNNMKECVKIIITQN